MQLDQAVDTFLPPYWYLLNGFGENDHFDSLLKRAMGTCRESLDFCNYENAKTPPPLPGHKTDPFYYEVDFLQCFRLIFLTVPTKSIVAVLVRMSEFALFFPLKKIEP